MLCIFVLPIGAGRVRTLPTSASAADAQVQLEDNKGHEHYKTPVEVSKEGGDDGDIEDDTYALPINHTTGEASTLLVRSIADLVLISRDDFQEGEPMRATALGSRSN
jgi:hypothetical protein